MVTKPALIIDSKARVSRKYLGDPGSPHFIPASPFIDRQFISDDDEFLLKKACALALKDIQSSDDDEVDPAVAYLAAHIQKSDEKCDEAKATAQVDTNTCVKPEQDRHKLIVRNQEADTNSSMDIKHSSMPTDRPSTNSMGSMLSLTKHSSAPKFGFLSTKRDSNTSQSGTLDSKSSDRAAAWMLTYLEKRISKDKDSNGCDQKRPDTAKTRPPTSRPLTNSSLHKNNIYGDIGAASASPSSMDINKRLPLLPGDGPEPELTKTQHITRLMKSLKKSQKPEDEVNPPDFENGCSMSVEAAHHPDIEVLEQTRQAKGADPTQDISLQTEASQDSAVNHINATSQQDEGAFIPPPRSASLSYLPDASPHGDSLTSSSTSTKRRFFSKRFAERFEWKRRKMPTTSVAVSSSHSMISAPILQVAS